MVADEVLKRDEERRRRRDEGEEDEEMEDTKDGNLAEGVAGSSRRNGNGEGTSKVVARTRVSQLCDLYHSQAECCQLRFTDSEVAEMRSLGLAPRRSPRCTVEARC